MELNQIRGLGTPTIQRLNKAGIRSVEQLALVDTRRKEIQGMSADKLIHWRKQAQRTIFQSAAKRFRTAARSAGRTVKRQAVHVETALREAVERTLAAAREAEAAAAEALRHAEGAAVELAERAAQKAARARETATQQFTDIQKRFSGNSAKRRRPKVDRYVDLLVRAERAARVAAESAQVAFEKAKTASGKAVHEVQVQSQSLYQRLVKRTAHRPPRRR